MCQSLASGLRVEIEKPVLVHYLKSLGRADYGFEQCWEDYRRIILGCLIYPVTVCGTLNTANERGQGAWGIHAVEKSGGDRRSGLYGSGFLKRVARFQNSRSFSVHLSASQAFGSFMSPALKCLMCTRICLVAPCMHRQKLVSPPT